ncbi:hypothetical protein [Thermogemmatispora sp.]|uniref:hypothetical protein n=1 Tax=Thermogemmatispora sp. TaxID=1968838 RepID=UPI001DA38236|nr:hypothetical protein [Thermogemmatispora sp.]MBX5449587.1 hypothetical protein [Thermogemmatispora sp.]
MREQRERSIQPAAAAQEGEEPQEEFDELDRLFIEHLPRLQPPAEVMERILTLTRQSASPRRLASEAPRHQSWQDGKSQDDGSQRADGHT